MDSHNHDLFSVSITYEKSTTNLLVVTLGIDSSNTCGAEETVLARRSERDITMPEPFQTLSSSKQPPWSPLQYYFRKWWRMAHHIWDKCTPISLKTYSKPW